jgi:hypothetical protein
MYRGQDGSIGSYVNSFNPSPSMQPVEVQRVENINFNTYHTYNYPQTNRTTMTGKHTTSTAKTTTRPYHVNHGNQNQVHHRNQWPNQRAVQMQQTNIQPGNDMRGMPAAVTHIRQGQHMQARMPVHSTQTIQGQNMQASRGTGMASTIPINGHLASNAAAVSPATSASSTTRVYHQNMHQNRNASREWVQGGLQQQNIQPGQPYMTNKVAIHPSPMVRTKRTTRSNPYVKARRTMTGTVTHPGWKDNNGNMNNGQD